jgi:hypothetical protein
MWIGISIVALMGICPPWVETQASYRGPVSEEPLGYSLLVCPPKSDGGWSGVGIDVVRLTLQWFVVALITGGAIVTKADKKETQ